MLHVEMPKVYLGVCVEGPDSVKGAQPHAVQCNAVQCSVMILFKSETP